MEFSWFSPRLRSFHDSNNAVAGVAPKRPVRHYKRQTRGQSGCCRALRTWAALRTRAALGSTAVALLVTSPCRAHVDPWPQSQATAAQTVPVKRIGSLDLQACGRQGAFCGRVERPLDPAEVLQDRISIYFEYYPHTGTGPAKGTLVATEGGPGYPATASRDDYLALFEPLRSDRDVVLMDNRGTGASGAVDCRSLQTAQQWTVDGVAQCGESLGERAPLYSTAYAADDLAAILEALGVRRIDLYGDSYGTYFEQVFAIRHPAALRSMVLDGAYPLSGNDYAWYPTYAPAMRAKFNLACARFPACAALPGTSIEHVLPALQQLRAHPFAARAYDSDGRERRIDADAAQLAIEMYGSAPASTSVRETDAAARAFTAGDTAPLLRLMAETATAVDSRDPTADATRWSAGLAAAVMCQDPPQIFDMRLPPPERAAERDRLLAERRRSAPDTYEPFTIDEYRAMPLDYSFLDQCVAWPVSPPGRPAAQIGLDASYPDVPALVIAGELDNITTPADGAEVAAAFKHGVQVLIANSYHVNALPRARASCGARIVQRFFETLQPGDTSCAARVPAVRLVPRFAREAAQLDAAVALPGNQADDARLRIAAATVLTVGDIIARIPANASGRGVGLRGGTFELTRGAAGVTLALDGVKWVDDVAVSGSVMRASPTDVTIAHDAAVPGAAMPRAAVPGPSSRARPRRAARPAADPPLWVTAHLRIAQPDGTSGRLSLRWREDLAQPQARIAGTIAGRLVAASVAAP